MPFDEWVDARTPTEDEKSLYWKIKDGLEECAAGFATVVEFSNARIKAG